MGKITDRIEEKVPEDILLLASCFVHAVKGKSTLAKSPNLVKKEELVSEPVYMKFIALAKALATTLIDVKEIVADLGLESGIVLLHLF